jgi:hypothetical protein
MGLTLFHLLLNPSKVESQDKEKDRNLGKSHLKNALDILSTKWPERIPLKKTITYKPLNIIVSWLINTKLTHTNHGNWKVGLEVFFFFSALNFMI